MAPRLTKYQGNQLSYQGTVKSRALVIAAVMVTLGGCAAAQNASTRSAMKQEGADLAAAHAQCKSEMAASDLDPIRSKVELYKDSQDTPAPAVDLPADQIQILRMLAALKNQNLEDIPEYEAAHGCDLTAAVFSYHAHELFKKRLVFASVYGEGTHYSITPSGSGWLIENGKMPK
jgi:hypothetical protein